MIFVDSSVWIDFFRGNITPESKKLASLLGTAQIGIGDLILAEVLGGFKHDRDFDRALRLMTSLRNVRVGGQRTAIRAARNYRRLRGHGITVRGAIDTLIATHCIEYGFALLYSDRDFDPFVLHLGLHSAMP